MIVFVNLFTKGKCHYKSYCSDINCHMTLNIIRSVVVTGKLGLGGGLGCVIFITLMCVIRLPHTNLVDIPFYWLCHVGKRHSNVIGNEPKVWLLR